MSPQTRPTEVIILTSLMILLGGVGVVYFVFVGTLMNSTGMDMFYERLNGDLGMFEISSITFVAITFFVTVGLVKEKSWIWPGILIFTGAGLSFHLYTSGIIELAITAVILYWLFRPRVKAYFLNCAHTT